MFCLTIESLHICLNPWCEEIMLLPVKVTDLTVWGFYSSTKLVHFPNNYETLALP